MSRRGGSRPPSRLPHPGDRSKVASGEKVSARGADRREQAAFGVTQEPAWLRVALDAMARHRAAREPLDRALEHGARACRLGPRERRRAGDLAFGWARARMDIEGLIDRALRDFGGVAPRVRERDRCALVLGALASGAEAPQVQLPPALANLVEEASSLGIGALLPARSAALPAWFSERVRNHFGPRSEALLEALRLPAPVSLAFDPRHLSRGALLTALADLGLRAEASPLSPYGVRVEGRFPLRRLPEGLRPHVWPMDEGSQAVALALEVADGERVLDLCAGGGGKTRLLLALGAYVTALDPDKGRLTAVKHRNVAEPNLACVRADGRSAPFVDGCFDKVLVDAPCSGTGTLRRSPDVVHRFHPDSLATVAQLQEALLVAAARFVRPGGRVVYATCSLLPEENREVVKAALASTSSLRECEAARDLLPSEHGCDGFFLAALERVGEMAGASDPSAA